MPLARPHRLPPRKPGGRVRPRRLASGLASALVLLAPGTALAVDAEVTSDTAAQFYDVRSPTGENVLNRRRLTTTLAVSAYDLLDAPVGDPSAPTLSFRARFRYDADYGVGSGSVDPTNVASVVPGTSQGMVDMMYAYVEGRRFFHGWLGFRLGRQYITDALGWWSFDGAQVTATTPFFVKAEGYGGFEQRGGMPLSTARFEGDGVWRGDRSNFDPSLAPAFQPAALAPAFGVALESTGFTWIHGRLTYRRVYDTGPSNVTEFASATYAPAVYDGGRVSSEKIGYAMDANLSTLGAVKAGVVYDLYNAEMTNLYATLDAYAGKKVTVSADYDYYVPTYDADSIWNFFAGEPMNDVGLRANVNVTDRLSVSGGGHLRVFEVQTGPLDAANYAKGYSPYTNYAPGQTVYPTNGHPFDEGGNLSARWRTGETLISLRGSGNGGGEGDRAGADIAAEHVFETRYVASVRTGVWQWNDKLEPDRSTTSFNYVLGLGYRFAPRSQAMVEWENDMNRLVGERYRLMVWLTLAVTK
jgi:hypothetical protein